MVVYPLLVIGIVAIAYAALAAGWTIRVIWKKRDERYRALYKEFLEQKTRVEGKMKGEDKNAR
jgi:hypothetical protein